MTSPVTLELKPEEVEFLNGLRRCALCDHLGALHEDFNAGADGEHCEFCEESSGACEGVSPLIFNECKLSDCACEGYR